MLTKLFIWADTLSFIKKAALVAAINAVIFATAYLLA